MIVKPKEPDTGNASVSWYAASDALAVGASLPLRFSLLSDSAGCIRQLHCFAQTHSAHFR